jgi:hypothetical protein
VYSDSKHLPLPGTVALEEFDQELQTLHDEQDGQVNESIFPTHVPVPGFGQKRTRSGKIFVACDKELLKSSAADIASIRC